MVVGKILWWDARDQNGVIVTGDGSKYYFDSSVVRSIRSEKLRSKLLVTFEVNHSVKGCLAAANVKIPTARSLKSLEKKFHSDLQLDLLHTGDSA